MLYETGLLRLSVSVCVWILTAMIIGGLDVIVIVIGNPTEVSYQSFQEAGPWLERETHNFKDIILRVRHPY